MDTIVKISIHASRGGSDADYPDADYLDYIDFNPRFPRGKRLYLWN